MKTTTDTKPSLEKIAQRAAKNAMARGEDFQGAQNEAYEAALNHGYSEDEAADCAKDAGVWHGDYRDNEQEEETPYIDSYIYEDEPRAMDNPGYRSCNCEDYPCCGH